MNAQTQAYLDETKTPSIVTLAEAKAALLAFAPEIGKLARQCAVYQEKMYGAVVAEADDGLVDALDVAQRELETLNSAVGQVISLLRQSHEFGKRFKVADDEVRVVASPLGYTV